MTDVIGWDPEKRKFKTLRGWIRPEEVSDEDLPKLSRFRA